MPKTLRMIDLCAGTGAFSYAFESTKKVKIVFANDYEESSKQMYDVNFKHKLELGDVCKINVKNVPTHDILTAGFPCQPFSVAGKQEGFNDKRSNVFWCIMKIVKHHKPKAVVLENVKNLVSHNDGKTFKTVLRSLQKQGYHISCNILNTSTVTNIPQNRERIYIVAVKSKKVFDNFNLDFKTVPEFKKKTVKDMLSTVKVDPKYYYDDPTNKTHTSVMKSVKNKNTVYQFRRVYVRENKNDECPTLTANMGSGGHNVPLIKDRWGVRKLTPRECFNFQGFPKSWKLSNLSDAKLYKLAGNAVSVPVVKLIAKRLVNELLKS